jgi:hypothetical protein
MRNKATGDKIVIKFGTARAPHHWGYYSFRADKDHGSIIDFVKNRKHMSLGAIRKELRPWIGQPPVPVPAFAAPKKTIKHRSDVEAAYAKMEIASSHPYLETERALPAALLQSERFAGRIRTDARGNAIFPHEDKGGLCGYEMKNAGFTGFAPGGVKGLWLSREEPSDKALVICESAIDALSHALLFPNDHARYASIGGKLNPTQPELIRAAIARMPADSEIIAAMDADAAGARLAETVREAVALTGRADLRFTHQEPFGYKDWNDQLRKKPLNQSPPYRGQEPSVA